MKRNFRAFEIYQRIENLKEIL